MSNESFLVGLPLTYSRFDRGREDEEGRPKHSITVLLYQI